MYMYPYVPDLIELYDKIISGYITVYCLLITPYTCMYMCMYSAL